MNRTLRVVYLYNGVFVFGASLLGPLYAVFVATFDTSVMTVSLSWSAFLLSSFLFTLIVARVGDGLKRKRGLLLSGFFVRALVWGGYAFVGDIYSLIGLQILLGLGEALGTPAFNAIVAEHLDRGKHIANFAHWKLYSDLSVAFGTIAGGIVVVAAGFRSLFVMMSILALISFFGVLRSPKSLYR